MGIVSVVPDSCGPRHGSTGSCNWTCNALSCEPWSLPIRIHCCLLIVLVILPGSSGAHLLSLEAGCLLEVPSRPALPSKVTRHVAWPYMSSLHFLWLVELFQKSFWDCQSSRAWPCYPRSVVSPAASAPNLCPCSLRHYQLPLSLESEVQYQPY
jgi:hypothetical protein